MKRKTMRILALSLALVMTLGILAACGNESNDTGGSTEPQILRFGTTGVDGKFLSILSNNLYDSYVANLVFEALISNDAAGSPIPYLATGWEVTNENLTYTFTLKDGIKFSDGTALTTADVAFTYRSMSHPDYDGPRSYAVSNLLGYEAFNAGETTEFPGVEVIDEKTIAFHYEPGMASPANIWDFGFGIMPEHIYAFTDWNEILDRGSDPIGSGMFLFDEYLPMEYVRLNTNADYWDTPNKPKIDGILMLDVPEESLQAAVQTGEIDLAQPATTMDNYNAFNAMDNARTIVYTDNGYQYMAFNTTRPQLSDHRVRQALMYALDRQAYIDVMLGALGSVGLAPISPASWAFPTEGLNDYAFNLERAAELMEEAGWAKGSDGIYAKDGERMAISWLVYDDSPWPGVVSELAYDSWRQLGIDLTIERMDFVTVISRTMDPEPGEKDFDIYTMGFSLSIDPDPSGALFDYAAYNAGGFNASGYLNERSQELILQGKTEFNQQRRIEIYHEWGRLMNEQLPSVIIAYRNALWVVSNRVQGMNIDTYWEWTRDIHTITLSS